MSSKNSKSPRTARTPYDKGVNRFCRLHQGSITNHQFDPNDRRTVDQLGEPIRSKYDKLLADNVELQPPYGVWASMWICMKIDKFIFEWQIKTISDVVGKKWLKRETESIPPLQIPKCIEGMILKYSESFNAEYY